MPRPGTRGVTRTLAIAAVAALTLAALDFRSPAGFLTARQPLPAVLDSVVVTMAQRFDTLRAGETLSGLLGRAGLNVRETSAMLAAASILDLRRLPVGMPVTYTSAAIDSTPSEVVFQLAIDRMLHLRRGAEGWASKEVNLPWTTDTIVIEGEIASTLYEAVAEAGEALPERARAELAWALADIYEYRLDMSRDLHVGDRFRVLTERSVGPVGTVRVGNILAARFMASGKDIEAIRYAKDEKTRARYYDAEGRSLHTGFLRAPLAFRRISSVFGRRKHPILGTWRAHKGTDYAASSGTPVRTVGDGVVIFAGVRGGYGNAVEVRHPNGYVTRYGHLRGFARGVRAGTRVSIAQTIGYVGATGLATGPHLHFEVLVNGVQRDPRKALASRSAEPIPSADRAAFEIVRAQLVATMDARTDVRQLAMR
ncbi:MAG TPA: M23 family metallopeptidase [Gemmatimonadaceae bacterium]|nr:M23 family metallopeptidase [Gemmatimonadaceae bacterium]